MMTLTPIKNALRPDMGRHGENYLLALAHEQTIRPIVRGYQKAVLEKHRFTNKGEILRVRRFRPELLIETKEYVVLDPLSTVDLADEDFSIYLVDCRLEQAKAGLKTETPEHCPLLVAEELTRNAQMALIDAMETVTGFTYNQLCCAGLDTLQRYTELILGLLISLGYVRTSTSDILNKIKQVPS